MRILSAFAATFLAATIIAAVSCSSTPAPVGLSEGCSINSDCAGSLVCAFGRCHVACATDKDCPGGGQCVLPGVCQLPEEKKCTSTLPCVSGLTCVGDTCFASCSTEAGTGANSLCLADQTCLEVEGQQICQPSPTDAGVDAGNHKNDSGVVTDAGEDTGHRHDATMPPDAGVDAHHVRDAGHDAPKDAPADTARKDAGHDSGVDVVNTCPSPQLQLSPRAQGDFNPSFTSGVGARTASDLYIFSGYYGPGAVDGSVINAVYAQAFDPATGKAKGASAPLFTATDLNMAALSSYGLTVQSAAVAPSGQVAVVYVAGFIAEGNPKDYSLYAAFLAPSGDAGADGGAAGLELEQFVLLQAAPQNTQPVDDQPYVFWSSTLQAFVISWQYDVNGAQGYIVVANYSATGGIAGGGANPVPTNNGAYAEDHDEGASVITGGAVGESRGLFGVAYFAGQTVNNYIYSPALTVLSASGGTVGPSAVLAPLTGSDNSSLWVTVAGVEKGFVYLYDNSFGSEVSEAFLPVSPDGGVVGGVPDGGDASSTFPTFSFPASAPRRPAQRAMALGVPAVLEWHSSFPPASSSHT